MKSAIKRPHVILQLKYTTGDRGQTQSMWFRVGYCSNESARFHIISLFFIADSRDEK